MNDFQKQFKPFLVFVCLCSSAFLFSGCDQGDIPVRKATVTILYEGEPVDGASVTFVPDEGEKTRPAVGLTDTTGQCAMITPGAKKRGCIPGKYAVSVSKRVNYDSKGNSFKPLPADHPDAKSKTESKVVEKILLPEKFEDTKTSDLEVEVKRRGTNHFVFNLDDE